MANNFDSNFTRKLMRSFLDSFESQRVLTKNVNTQLFQGKFNPSTGDTIDVKRPTDYVSVRTPTGDLTAETKSDIITGKASAVVQNYFTTFVDFDEADEAIKMDQLDELLAPMATRMKTDFELDYAKFMKNNAGLLSGTYGSPALVWDDIAAYGSIMDATGVPRDSKWNVAVNPFTQTNLASNQRSLGSGGTSGGLISEAHREAILSDNFAGMKVMSANTLASNTIAAGADRAGTVTSLDVTYVTAKDTMTQSIVVAAFTNDLVIKAGEVVQITGRNRLNLSTREEILDGTGAVILFTGTVTTDVTLSATGTGTIVITGPAIFESAGQYNTTSTAVAAADVITLLGAAADIIQPNLFWHKDAFTVASVPIKRLKATDSIATTEDGLQFRVTRDSDFTKNENLVRIDFRPAYGVLNPFFAGQGFGTP
ncbi:MAG: P22 phage major capsid protein family protein [Nitrosomonadaceae bacterium]